MALTITLSLVIALVWSLTHRYKGLAGDAELYAVQALAKIHPQLAHDLFLLNVSQDRFTAFSPFYAWCIGWMGPQGAGLALTILFKIAFLTAAWWVARRLSDIRVAYFSVALLVITSGGYGAYNVFHYSEDWITARSVAEALVVAALAMHLSGFRWLAVLIAAASLFIHPLMALPGLLFILSLWMPIRFSVTMAAAGTLGALAISCIAVAAPDIAHIFTIIDKDWLEVVRERSQFLFPQLWTRGDWELNSRPFLTLMLSVLVLPDTMTRKFSLVAMLVGATGMALAIIASTIGPVAIFLQGQPWRWVWITEFASVVLLAPTAVQVWRDAKCGPLCALLLLCGWTLSTLDSTSCILAAIALWAVRDLVPPRSARLLGWSAIAVGVVLCAWTVGNLWTLLHTLPSESGREPAPITIARNIFGLEGLAPLLTWAVVGWALSMRSPWRMTTFSALMVIALAFVLPGTFNDVGRSGMTAKYAEFADWRDAIPISSTVLVIPSPASATFAWLTLERASYLTVDQSSGVVFSRQTAMEIRRRAKVVEPLWDTNWRLLSHITRPASVDPTMTAPNRPLTREILVHVCGDPLLDFVIGKEDVGFAPLVHSHAGNWKNWKLYDCRRVNARGDGQ